MNDAQSLEDIAREHRMLLNEYGRVQQRCSDLIAGQAGRLEQQAQRIRQLEAETMRLRGELVARDTALACAREDMANLKQAIPGLPTRITLARRVESLSARVQDLMRELLRMQWLRKESGKSAAADVWAKSVLCIGREMEGADTRRAIESAGGRFLQHAEEDDHAALEASLVAADLVICQTGCVSHDAYWRVQDHCRRTGKQCVLVEQPQAMRFVRSVETASEPATAASTERMGTSV